MNSKDEAKVVAEMTINQTTTITPYKFFGPKYVSVILQNFILNSTRIFMRVLNIYREYISKNFDFRWK
jgi:hypothetical protein